MNFKNLHHENTPLLVANVWDVASARMAEKLGFVAIATSSAAISEMFGYEDGENIPFERLLWVVERISLSTSLPFSVDIEGGYSREIPIILENVGKLLDLGVVGINIEDSVVNYERELIEANVFATIISQIKQKFADKIFINARTDTYLLDTDEVLKETLSRTSVYEQAGADGVFIPCLADKVSIKTICGGTSLPVNLLSVPGLADFSKLTLLGVKRLSFGNFAFNKLQYTLSSHFTKIQRNQSFDDLFIR